MTSVVLEKKEERGKRENEEEEEEVKQDNAYNFNTRLHSILGERAVSGGRERGRGMKN